MYASPFKYIKGEMHNVSKCLSIGAKSNTCQTPSAGVQSLDSFPSICFLLDRILHLVFLFFCFLYIWFDYFRIFEERGGGAIWMGGRAVETGGK